MLHKQNYKSIYLKILVLVGILCILKKCYLSLKEFDRRIQLIYIKHLWICLPPEFIKCIQSKLNHKL